MKYIIICTIVLVTALSSVFGQTRSVKSTQRRTAERAVERLESEMWVAYSCHDSAALKRVLADDLTFTKENGFVTTKAQEIHNQERLNKERGQDATRIMPNPADADSRYSVQKVRVYGDAAVTTGYVHEKASDSKELVRFHFTNTWVRRRGRWQAVAIQITSVATK